MAGGRVVPFGAAGDPAERSFWNGPAPSAPSAPGEPIRHHALERIQVSRDLDRAIAAVYAGPPEEFVSRRNALVKELRAGERRDEATEVKVLRKPTRIAWALNAAAAEEPESMHRIADAIASLLAAQAGDGDLRDAMNEMREATQALATNASRAAADAGHNVDHGALVNAVMAIIGTAGAFEMLEGARLADVPEAGGLDFLTSLPRIAPRRDLMVRPGKESAEEAAAREAVRQAEEALLAARKISDDAERGLRDAQVEADDAGRRLRLAQKEAHVRQTALDRARKAATSAGSELKQAEARLADAKANLPS
jgi:hypothetical protein